VTAALLLLQLTVPAPAWSRPPVPLAAPTLTETSALVASRTYPGVLWTLNDSDNPPELFATDTAGHALGRIRVLGAKNVDWEALASGPCPGAGRAVPARAPTCLYVGDIGDNSRVRSFVTIYRVREPRPGIDTSVAILDSLRLTYPDGPRDAESVVVDAGGTLWIISKELLQSPRMYEIPKRSWDHARAQKLVFVDSLPIPSASGIEHWVTDATWLGRGDTLIVRTYGELWVVPFLGGRPHPDGTRPLCSLQGLGPQGEGVAWLGKGLFGLTSEKLFHSPASIALVRCGG
jgi:hypothetical protein